MLDAGTTQADELIEQHVHEPSGYFWQGVAQFLASTKAPALEGRFSCDSEGGMFCAYSSDRPALQELADLMSTVATDADQMRNLIASATAGDFEFDD